MAENASQGNASAPTQLEGLGRRGILRRLAATAVAAPLALTASVAAADPAAAPARLASVAARSVDAKSRAWAAAGVAPAEAARGAPNLSPLAYLRALDETLEARLSFPADGNVPVAQWQQELRPRLASLLGTFAEVGSVPPAAREADVQQREGFEQRLVYVRGAAGQDIPVYVLVPAGQPGPFPVVIALHGHGAGAADVLGMPPDWRTGELAQEEGQPFAPDLARGGALVFVPEQFGFGPRRHPDDIADRPPWWDSSSRLAAPLLHLGQTLLGLRVWEARQVIDYALTHPLALGMPAPPVGLVGFSGGATVALFTAALDLRVSAAVVAEYYCDWSWSILSRYHTPDNYVPGLRAVVEVSDVAGLVAPRALFLEAGEQDESFPIEGFRQALEPLQQVYARAAAAGQLRHDAHPDGHQFQGRLSLPWLLGSLRAAAAARA